jgi:hypothetical protein
MITCRPTSRACGRYCELSAEILDGDGDVSYRMELVVRRGARGVYIGGDGNFSDQNELLLARDADYVVTGIEREPGGTTILYAEVLLSSGPDDPSGGAPRSGPTPGRPA